MIERQPREVDNEILNPDELRAVLDTVLAQRPGEARHVTLKGGSIFVGDAEMPITREVDLGGTKLPLEIFIINQLDRLS